ncbi:MAG: hypothetical protein VR69_00360 [Peptococcaceae bacterium BRH_c4b]|nr:MAG: hypothetical protein VR69_00360 [Peptococcaceae bacterium BRH_c4b]
MEEERKGKLTLTVNVRLEQAQEQELPEVMLYAFDVTGQFLTEVSVPKGEQSQVKLQVPSKLVGTAVRLVLGPVLAEEQEEVPPWMAALIHRGETQKKTPSLAALRRVAYEKRIRLDAEKNIINVTVFSPEWTKWLFCPCVVRGRLVKRVSLPDGTTKELGVCGACVKIYEVDKIPMIILQLPERDLFRLRDDLRVFIEKQPEVWPPTTPVTINPQPEPSGVMIETLRADMEAAPLTMETRSKLEPVFQATSANELRTALISRADILAVYICALKWLWYKLHTDLIKCCCTDEQGRFKTTIWYRCTGDKPDLYFKAVQCIGGTLHTLYNPVVACHTHWNYVCGTDIVLETDDPAAITCVPPDPVDPPPGVSVWVMPWGVGGVRLDAIKSSGLTDFTDGDGTWIDAPFGGRLGFRHGYSSGIPSNTSGKPLYYRWQYNKLDSAGNETEWRDFAPPVAETVVRHYVDYDLAHPDLPPTFPAYPLGPQEKNNMHLYEFKPHQPPQIPGHKREWPVDDWFNDIYSGILQSSNLPGGVLSAAGKYKIKLEIYDKDGTLLNPGPGTFDFIVPTGVASDGTTILTRNANAGEIQGGGFIFYLHVDNNKCQAEIYEASIKGVAAGPCGFISYDAGDDVRLSFRVHHPKGYARFKFTTVRGSSGYAAAACAPANPDVAWANAPLLTDTPVNGFSLDIPDVFSKDVDEAAIRGGCPKAAFGENIYVAATATNGWVRLSGLDASAMPKAFALEPNKP